MKFNTIKNIIMKYNLVAKFTDKDHEVDVYDAHGNLLAIYWINTWSNSAYMAYENTQTNDAKKFEKYIEKHLY